MRWRMCLADVLHPESPRSFNDVDGVDLGREQGERGHSERRRASVARGRRSDMEGLCLNARTVRCPGLTLWTAGRECALVAPILSGRAHACAGVNRHRHARARAQLKCTQ
eukprot:3420936-Rhodomonas_salina.1